METSRPPSSDQHPAPALPFSSHHLSSGRSSPFLHPAQQQQQQQQQQQAGQQQAGAMSSYAAGHAAGGHPPHIRTHSANAAFTLGAGMATSPITPTVSSERGRGEDWAAPEQAAEQQQQQRGGSVGASNGDQQQQQHESAPQQEGASDEQQAGSGGSAPADNASNEQLAADGTANGSLQVNAGWQGATNGQPSRPASTGTDAQQAAIAAQAQYYAQHPSQLQYMYYPPAMAGAYGQHLASQPVYSSQAYSQQQQVYAMEAARQVQAQQQLGGQQVSSASNVSAHPNSPSSHAAALAAVAAVAAGQMPAGQSQQQAGAAGAQYYMPYSYGGAQPGAQAPMYHYVSGVAGYPSVYPQPLYRPPYPTSALAASHSQPLSMADALQNVPDEAGPSSANHAASDAGGSEYSSILGAAEHELEPEQETVKPAPAPARTANSSRKGKRKATAAAEKRSSNEDREEDIEIPAPPPEKVLKMPVEAKVSKKRPKRKRPPGSQAGKEKKHGCSHCGRSFARAYNLKTHEETHLMDPPKPYICEHDSCNHKSFSRSHDLIRHRGSVHNEGPAAGKPPQKKTRPPKKKVSGRYEPDGTLGSAQGSSLDHDENHYADESMTTQGHDDHQGLDHDDDGGHHLADGAEMAHDEGHLDNHNEDGGLGDMPEYDPALIEPALFHTSGGDDDAPVDPAVAAATINPMDFGHQDVKPGIGGGGAHGSTTPSALLQQAHAGGYYPAGGNATFGGNDQAAAGGGEGQEEGEVEHALLDGQAV